MESNYYNISLILILFAMALSYLAQMGVMRAYEQNTKVLNSQNLTGYQVARKILDDNGLFDVNIVESSGGVLSDYYDPKKKIVCLSSHNYHNASISAAAIAAHEVGHAIQHHTHYIGIVIRNSFLPLAIISSNVYMFIIMVSLILQLYNLLLIGIILYAMVGVFQLITLPVEFDASFRALRILKERFNFQGQEYKRASKVLRAAALTYIAAFIGTIAQVARFVLLYYSRNKEN